MASVPEPPDEDTDDPLAYSELFEEYCRNCRAYTQVYNIFENGVIQFTACNTCSHIT